MAMKIEILFPEFCNLFGDMSNMSYLRQCLSQAEFVETSFSSQPLFVQERPSLIYLGPMTERTQEKVIAKLFPYKERLWQLIEEGVSFLFTGNALEVLGEYIETEDGSRIPALNLFQLHAKRDMMHRHNSTFLGRLGQEEVMGFKSQFTMAFAPPGYHPFLEVIKGVGLHEKCETEGIHYKNFVGTYLLGPVLILNPCLVKLLLAQMGFPEAELAFAPEMESAYQQRLKDFHAKT